VLLVRSIVFALGMWVSVIIFATLCLFTAPFSFAVRYGFLSKWARLNLWWLALTCGVRYQVEGYENIPEGNAIVMSKHQSTWETLALQMIFPPQVWVLKRELLKVPFFGWGLALLEPISIDRKARGKARQQLIDQGTERLKNGRWVVIFPEGTRIPPGEKGRYALGGALLAENSGYPIVPMAHNAGEFWPRRKFIKQPGVVKVRIGPPIDSKGKSASEINKEVETWIEGQMAEITFKRNPVNEESRP